jgi:hypothetical protein
MKNKFKTCEYRLFKIEQTFCIIKVFYDSKGKIISHSSFIYPTALTEKDIKLQISDMLKATRKPALTDKDLDGTI